MTFLIWVSISGLLASMLLGVAVDVGMARSTLHGVASFLFGSLAMGTLLLAWLQLNRYQAALRLLDPDRSPDDLMREALGWRPLGGEQADGDQGGSG